MGNNRQEYCIVKWCRTREYKGFQKYSYDGSHSIIWYVLKNKKKSTRLNRENRPNVLASKPKHY
jgi:hypothetical protein